MMKLKEHPKQRKPADACLEKKKKTGTTPSDQATQISAIEICRAAEEDGFEGCERKELVKGSLYRVILTSQTVGEGEYAAILGPAVKFTGFHFHKDPKIKYDIEINVENIAQLISIQKEEAQPDCNFMDRPSERKTMAAQPHRKAPHATDAQEDAKAGDEPQEISEDPLGDAHAGREPSQKGPAKEKEGRSEKEDVHGSDGGHLSMVILVTDTYGYGKLVEETESHVRMEDFMFSSDPRIKFGITIMSQDIKEIVRLRDLQTEVEKLRLDSEKTEGAEALEGNLGEGDSQATMRDAGPEALGEAFCVDSEISSKKRTSSREYTSFYPESAGLRNSEKCHLYERAERGKKWDQFKANEKLFGVKLVFDEDIYTTRLDKNSKFYRKHSKEAELLAQEIDSPSSANPHIEEERGRAVNLGEDEKYGSVVSIAEKSPASKKPIPKKKTKKEGDSRIQFSITAPHLPAGGEGASIGSDFSSRLFLSHKGNGSETMKITPVSSSFFPQKKAERKFPEADSRKMLQEPQPAEPSVSPTSGAGQKRQEPNLSRDPEEERGSAPEKQHPSPASKEKEMPPLPAASPQPQLFKKEVKTKFNISAPSFNPNLVAKKRYSFADKIRERAKRFVDMEKTPCSGKWGDGPSYLYYNDVRNPKYTGSPKLGWP